MDPKPVNPPKVPRQAPLRLVPGVADAPAEAEPRKSRLATQLQSFADELDKEIAAILAS